ncbi:PH domain-containing protein [Singulisphaera sp. GP187]|uniref:PH domain-containing protein n=1 Tax=Singulisphaera sp. GP187 TaxID=1882752 RepID=UPI0009279C0F|nr:PH domain-containing protein [Singulisphaera sp. GP187]SIO65657.1 PH domain-containing protein [Singulisphaera sp. GP187]
MATNDTSPNIATTEVSTRFDGPPTVTEPESPHALYPPEGPEPAGTTSSAGDAIANRQAEAATQGTGVEGEEVVWEGRYAMRNFMGRIAVRVLLTVAWLAFVGYAMGYRNDNDLGWLVAAGGFILAAFWLALIYRMIQAHFGHDYRLTNRRLFVSTGLMRRRQDMMELLSVKDVFTRQTLFERWLSLGTVVVVSSANDLPVFYVAGVQDPKEVMDLIWHHARSERDHRSVKVENI